MRYANPSPKKMQPGKEALPAGLLSFRHVNYLDLALDALQASAHAAHALAQAFAASSSIDLQCTRHFRQTCSQAARTMLSTSLPSAATEARHILRQTSQRLQQSAWPLWASRHFLQASAHAVQAALQLSFSFGASFWAADAKLKPTANSDRMAINERREMLM